jgi:hypothetical protein
MNILAELRQKYTPVELGLLAVSMASVIISAALMESRGWLAISMLTSALIVIATIVASRSRSEHQLDANFGIKFDGLSIKGDVVSEFSYLLRYVTNGALENFNDFQAIYEHREHILRAVERELSQELMREQAFGVSRETAETHLKKLAAIVTTISDYYKETVRHRQ